MPGYLEFSSLIKELDVMGANITIGALIGCLYPNSELSMSGICYGITKIALNTMFFGEENGIKIMEKRIQRLREIAVELHQQLPINQITDDNALGLLLEGAKKHPVLGPIFGGERTDPLTEEQLDILGFLDRVAFYQGDLDLDETLSLSKDKLNIYERNALGVSIFDEPNTFIDGIYYPLNSCSAEDLASYLEFLAEDKAAPPICFEVGFLGHAMGMQITSDIQTGQLKFTTFDINERRGATKYFHTFSTAKDAAAFLVGGVAKIGYFMPRLMLRSNSKNQLISQEEALKRAYKKFRPDEDDLKHEYCPAKIEEVIESVTAQNVAKLRYQMAILGVSLNKEIDKKEVGIIHKAFRQAYFSGNAEILKILCVGLNSWLPNAVHHKFLLKFMDDALKNGKEDMFNALGATFLFQDLNYKEDQCIDFILLASKNYPQILLRLMQYDVISELVTQEFPDLFLEIQKQKQQDIKDQLANLCKEDSNHNQNNKPNLI